MTDVIDVVMAGIGPPGPVSGAAGGDLTGAFPDPSIKAGAVTEEKLADASVTLAKLADGAVSEAKLSFSVATQLEIDAVVASLTDAIATKATPADVEAAVTALVSAAPEVLDTLNELAAALGDDPNFATTVLTALAGKQDLIPNGTLVQVAGDTMTGPLVLAGDATDDLHPVTFQQLSAYTGGTRAIAHTTADQSFANDTLANVTELVLPVLANTVYRVSADIHYNAAAAADIKLKWTAPAGASFRWDADDAVTRALADTASVTGDGTDQSIRITGLLVVAGTAGSLQLQAAQAAVDATPTKVLLHSFAEAWSP